MGKARKNTGEILLPGGEGWSRWAGPEGEACAHQADFGQSAGVFSKEAPRRVLALPAAHMWVLPAWLKGQAEHLHGMAQLHLERMGIRVADAANGVDLRYLAENDGAHLTCLLALKEMAAPMWDMSRLPDEVVLHAECYDLPSNSIVLFSELGRLVVAVTHGKDLIYCSPLAAHHLNAQALSELNNICLQLGFQGVLGRVESIVLWLPESEADLQQIQRLTGLPAHYAERPAPVLPKRGKSRLMLPQVLAARRRKEANGRTRLMLLTGGLAIAAAVAVMAVFTAMALKERNLLRERVAVLAPKASRVLDHKKSWLEAAPAVDPTTFPMQRLLQIMEPASSAEISMSHFEFTPERLILRGRTPTPSLALEYAEAVKDVPGLEKYGWDTPPPTIASDNSATFELKGALVP